VEGAIGGLWLRHQREAARPLSRIIETLEVSVKARAGSAELALTACNY
jgi:hypothetical protein